MVTAPDYPLLQGNIYLFIYLFFFKKEKKKGFAGA